MAFRLQAFRNPAAPGVTLLSGGADGGGGNAKRGNADADRAGGSEQLCADVSADLRNVRRQGEVRVVTNERMIKIAHVAALAALLLGAVVAFTR